MPALTRIGVAFAAAAAFAQTTAPNPTTIDNEIAHVFTATEQPHRKGAVHEHPMNRVLIYLTAGTTEFTHPNAPTERRTYKAGEAVWSPAGGLHTSENVTDNPVKIVEIELKNKPAAAAKMETSNLDPVKADPKHYHLEFENEQVRVVRVRFGPHEKGVLHEHKLPHLVVYLTDQTKGKAGEFRLDAPETHTEENTLDHAVERIAIDFK